MNIHNLEFCTCADGQNSERFLARAIVRLVESGLYEIHCVFIKNSFVLARSLRIAFTSISMLRFHLLCTSTSCSLCLP